MRLRISAPGVGLGAADRDHIEQRIAAALAWPAELLRDVVVRVRDVNERPGRQWRSCVLRVTLHDGAQAVIEERHGDLRNAVDAAVHRASRIVARMVRRRRRGRGPGVRAATFRLA